MEAAAADWLALQQATFERAVGWFAGPQDPAVSPRLERIARLAAIGPGDRVLDVGTGTGALLPFLLAREPAHVVALDLTPAMAAYARDRYGDRVEIRIGDVASMEERERFDVVICNAMFWNLFDRDAALVAIQRALVAGGRLIISHPMGAQFVRDLRLQDPATVADDPVDDGPTLASLAAAGFAVTLRVDEPDFYLLLAIRR
jgi:SAM-dependent methyltransferase